MFVPAGTAMLASCLKNESLQWARTLGPDRFELSRLEAGIGPYTIEVEQDS
jgi:hypothetical protein